MTLTQQIARVCRELDFAQTFRENIAGLTEGPAKPALLAQADATVAKIEAALRDLEALAADPPRMQETLQ